MLTLRTVLSRLSAFVFVSLVAASAWAAPRTVIGELWSQDN